MSLLPFLMDYELQPRRLRDQHFGLALTDDDFLSDILHRPAIHSRHYVRPWRKLAAAVRDVGSTLKVDKDKFQVNLDVQHFAPEDISVKTADGYVIIEGKHEEKKDDHGYVSRQFKRRYALPEDCSVEAVESKLSSDGVLTVMAPRRSIAEDERSVPITHTGPVRRKYADEEEMNGELEANGKKEEEKSPQKKKTRR